MSVMLNLSAETEQLLREKAAQLGQTLEDYIEGLVEREAQATDRPLPKGAKVTHLELAPDEWVAQWYAWAQGQLPRAVVPDDSRESIYAGRGE